MKRNRALSIVILILLPLAGAGSPPEGSDPVGVFADLDGVWAGTFVGYDSTGVELYRIAVRQEYRTVNSTTQTVRLRDTMPDGTVITGRGENIARRRPDGSLELKCVVRKSNGDRVEHDGRLVTGPDGAEQLVWHSNAADRTETFREQVFESDGRLIYEINGLGRYNDSLILMAGRYVKQADP